MACPNLRISCLQLSCKEGHISFATDCWIVWSNIIPHAQVGYWGGQSEWLHHQCSAPRPCPDRGHAQLQSHHTGALCLSQAHHAHAAKVSQVRRVWCHRALNETIYWSVYFFQPRSFYQCSCGNFKWPWRCRWEVLCELWLLPRVAFVKGQETGREIVEGEWDSDWAGPCYCIRLVRHMIVL